MQNMIRIAFVLNGNGWMGGVNYYRNLFSALALLPELKLHPVIFVGTEVPERILSNFKNAEIVRTRLLNAGTPLGYLRRILDVVSSRHDPLLAKLLSRHRIDVLSHSGSLSPTGSIKTIGWIPDFQHLHLHEFFSADECVQRNAYFNRIARNCDRVILSSETAQRDLATFAPTAMEKSRVLRFVPEVDVAAPLATLSTLEQKYGFKRPYFYIPNQFWKHKNHAVAIDALAELQRKGVRATILLSGDTSDYRHPTHLADLMTRVKQSGLDDSFKVLGVIPYPDLISLIHHSLAIINPSLFEGWSSTVEEAKALGKTILLSNLPVHIEQNPERGIYFDPHNAADLMEKMLSLLAEASQPGMESNEFVFSKSYKTDRLDFARNYQTIVMEVVGRTEVL
jgi:glycosyltransferase involved in cell wall biosynthesis